MRARNVHELGAKVQKMLQWYEGNREELESVNEIVALVPCRHLVRALERVPVHLDVRVIDRFDRHEPIDG